MGRRRRGPHGAQRARHAAPGPGRAGRADVRRRAAAHRDRRAAGAPRGPADPRRAHQPPRRRRHRLAGAAPAAAPRRAHGRHPRPVVPRRGLHDHVGGRRRDRARLRGRIRGLDPRAGRAAAGRRRGGVPPAEPAAQGDRLAAARPAGAHQQAEVPHRRGQRADRRRAAGPRHGVTAAPGRLAAGQAGVRAVQGGPAGRVADPAVRRGLAGRPRRPDRDPRRQRGRQDDAAAGPGRRPRPRRRPHPARQHRAGRVPVAGAARAAGRAAPARGGRGGRQAGQARRPGADRVAAGGGVRLHRRPGVDAGRRPVRR